MRRVSVEGARDGNDIPRAAVQEDDVGLEIRSVSYDGQVSVESEMRVNLNVRPVFAVMQDGLDKLRSFLREG